MVAEIRPSLGTNIYYCCGIIACHTILVLATPITSCYIYNQDLLLTDIHRS